MKVFLQNWYGPKILNHMLCTWHVKSEWSASEWSALRSTRSKEKATHITNPVLQREVLTHPTNSHWSLSYWVACKKYRPFVNNKASFPVMNATPITCTGSVINPKFPHYATIWRHFVRSTHHISMSNIETLYANNNYKQFPSAGTSCIFNDLIWDIVTPVQRCVHNIL
jgi:hypothetical protein